MTERAISRRALLTAGGAVSLAALLSACGNSSTADSDGSWSFTDDRGETATASGTPTRVVAYIGAAAALWDYGVTDQVVGVFGPTTTSDGDPDVQVGNMDLSGVESLGNAWGEFNVEKYAGLEPQLLITNMVEEDVLWYLPEESLEQIEQLAPTIGLATSKVAKSGASLTDMLERHISLAEELGADVNSDSVTEARERFESVSESLSAAVEENAGIKVLAASADDDLFYVSTASAYADLEYFAELGVEIVEPDTTDDGFFESISWENADKYEADVILLDDRAQALQPDDLTDKPTWTKMPAVQADQVIGWTSEPRMSHAGMVEPIEALSGALSKASRVSDE